MGFVRRLVCSYMDLNRIYLLYLCPVRFLRNMIVAVTKHSACKEFIPLLFSLNQPNFQDMDHFNAQAR